MDGHSLTLNYRPSQWWRQVGGVAGEGVAGREGVGRGEGVGGSVRGKGDGKKGWEEWQGKSVEGVTGEGVGGVAGDGVGGVAGDGMRGVAGGGSGRGWRAIGKWRLGDVVRKSLGSSWEFEVTAGFSDCSVMLLYTSYHL